MFAATARSNLNTSRRADIGCTRGRSLRRGERRSDETNCLGTLSNANLRREAAAAKNEVGFEALSARERLCFKEVTPEARPAQSHFNPVNIASDILINPAQWPACKRRSAAMRPKALNKVLISYGLLSKLGKMQNFAHDLSMSLRFGSLLLG